MEKKTKDRLSFKVKTQLKKEFEAFIDGDEELLEEDLNILIIQMIVQFVLESKLPLRFILKYQNREGILFEVVSEFRIKFEIELDDSPMFIIDRKDAFGGNAYA